jgi:glycosyltransferase involved in cell wall biosynthesis
VSALEEARTDGADAPRASIVVCTRDRGEAIEPTLAAAAGLEAPFRFEVLVVDNGSSDGTTAIVAEWVRRRPDRVRLAVEPVVGLSAARNCGLRLARGEWIGFLDDDALPAPGWLAAYDRVLAEPEVLSAGGPVVPDYDAPLPEWLEPRWRVYLSVWDRGSEEIDLVYNELPRGANVAYRREAFERVGDFDRRLGRIGRSLRSCEEIELGLRLERIGARCRYVPAAGVRHRVEARRLTPAWLERRFDGQGFSEAIVDWKHGGWAALRRGAGRARQAEAWAIAEEGGASLRARFERAARRGYRRGSVFALVAVGRWDPPAGDRPPG